jgi:hypothetical protein
VAIPDPAYSTSVPTGPSFRSTSIPLGPDIAYAASFNPGPDPRRATSIPTLTVPTGWNYGAWNGGTWNVIGWNGS